MGAYLSDLRDQLRYDLADDIRRLAAIYMTVEMNPPKIHLWSFLNGRDEEAEDRLAMAEARLMASFPGIEFDFTTIHLRGRDPAQFIPAGSVYVHISPTSEPVRHSPGMAP